MSWDVFVMRFPAEFTDEEDIPRGWDPPPLGTLAELRSKILWVLPDLEIRPDGWGMYDGDGFSVEIPLLGDDGDEQKDVALYFRGSGDAAADLAVDIAEALDGRAMDSTGEFLERSTAAGTWQSWQRYRDQVVGRAGQPEA